MKSWIVEKVLLYKKKIFSVWEKVHKLNLPSLKPRFLSDILIKMGNLLRLWLELPHHAIFFYENAYKHDQKCLKALFFIALTLRSIGKSSLALEFYAQALKYDPFFVDCHFNSGNIYLEEFSQLDQAKSCYVKVLAAFQNTEEAPLVNIGRIFSLLAEVSAQSKEFKFAVFMNIKGFFIFIF